MSRKTSDSSLALTIPPGMSPENFLAQFEVGSPPWRYLMGIAPLPENSELAGCSVDTIKRNHPDKVRKLGPKRIGMRRLDALFLNWQPS